MNYNIKPVESYYGGQHFKSLLEARWACFFDICGWKWSYEPLKINNRIPDFVLKGAKFDIIAEVKPSIFVDDVFLKSLYDNYKCAKMHVLILTDNPFSDSDSYLEICKGYEATSFSDKYELMFPVESFVMKSENDISTVIYIWDGLFFEETERKNFLHFDYGPDHNEIKKIMVNWKKAGMVTKFNSY